MVQRRWQRGINYFQSGPWHPCVLLKPSHCFYKTCVILNFIIFSIGPQRLAMSLCNLTCATQRFLTACTNCVCVWINLSFRQEKRQQKWVKYAPLGKKLCKRILCFPHLYSLLQNEYVSMHAFSWQLTQMWGLFYEFILRVLSLTAVL